MHRIADLHTSNWTDYGGMDVYLNATLHPGAYHDLFYTDPNVATHYMNYVQAVVSRYANSPAIFAWELANEARCAGTGPNPQSPSACSPAVVTAWVDKMSSYIKSLDSNHMVSSPVLSSETGDRLMGDERRYLSASKASITAPTLPTMSSNTTAARAKISTPC